MKPEPSKTPKPFLKWAGGKTQLLPELDTRLPEDFRLTVRVYAEPFVGGGALLFHLLSKGFRPERVVINDSNPDLANTYRVVQSHAGELVETLEKLQAAYRSRTGEDERRAFYIDVRDAYNAGVSDRTTNPVRRTALLVFSTVPASTGFTG